MSSFATEIQEWSTPLLGAYLLWRFTQGYESVGERRSPEFLFHFVVLPIVESPELARPIHPLRKDFSSYVRSFAKDGKMDVLAKLNDKVFQQRLNTLRALDIGSATRLFEWKDGMTRLHATRQNEGEIAIVLSDSIRRLGVKAFRFGTWTAFVDLPVFTGLLGVQL
jgi:hypothetical protein